MNQKQSIGNQGQVVNSRPSLHRLRHRQVQLRHRDAHRDRRLRLRMQPIRPSAELSRAMAATRDSEIGAEPTKSGDADAVAVAEGTADEGSSRGQSARARRQSFLRHRHCEVLGSGVEALRSAEFAIRYSRGDI